jgi:hypothetical protein
MIKASQLSKRALDQKDWAWATGRAEGSKETKRRVWIGRRSKNAGKSGGDKEMKMRADLMNDGLGWGLSTPTSPPVARPRMGDAYDNE